MPILRKLPNLTEKRPQKGTKRAEKGVIRLRFTTTRQEKHKIRVNKND
jgi:hypothetical protein